MLYLKEDCITKDAHQKGNVPQQEFGDSRVRKLVSGSDPSGRPLVADQMLGHSAQLWDGLNGAGSTANHCHCLVLEINRSIPQCSMDNFAGESLELRRDVWDTQGT